MTLSLKKQPSSNVQNVENSEELVLLNVILMNKMFVVGVAVKGPHPYL